MTDATTNAGGAGAMDGLQTVCFRVLASFAEGSRVEATIDMVLKELRERLRAERAFFLRITGDESGTPDSTSCGGRDIDADLLEAAREEGKRLLRWRPGTYPVADAPPRLARALEERGWNRVLVAPIQVERGLSYVVLITGAAGRLLVTDEQMHALATMFRSLSNAIFQRTVRHRGMLQAMKLREALEDARAANEAKSQFLAIMSHEIRTPMTAIVGFAKLLGQPNIREKERARWAEHISRNSDYLLELVNDVLDISKIEAHQFELDIQPCEVRRVLSRTVELMRPRADEKMLELELRFDETVPDTIPADPLRLRQIVANLVQNGVKYTSEGSVRVDVTLEPKTRAGMRFLRIAVADTGEGIDPKHKPTLFQPFKQARRADETIAGVGLGLSLVKEFVDRLGGEIAVQSEPGKGSTFTVRLEVPNDYELTYADVDSTDTPIVHTDLPLEGRRILVVDDSEVNLELFTLLITTAGGEAVPRFNGAEAVDPELWQAMKGEPFDLVLMDMQMPVMDGYEATATLKERGVKAPIVALTAFATSADRDRCLEAGCDSYISKPIDPGRFVIQVSDILFKQGQDTASDRSAGGWEDPGAGIEDPGADTEDTDVDAENTELAEEAAAAQEAPEPDPTPAGDPMKALVAGLAAKLIATFDKWIETAEELRAQPDRNMLRSHCHKLKGSAGSLGMPEISTLAAVCETLLKGEHPLEDVDEPLGELRSALAAKASEAA